MYSPTFACAGALTVKRADSDSSSCVKSIDAFAGVDFHAAASSSATVACAAAFVPFVTVTCTSRSAGFVPPVAGAGMTASAGVTFTENAGTTFSSMRLSPL